MLFPYLFYKIIQTLIRVKDEVKQIISHYGKGRKIKHGVKVALLGKPNTGKSSILNRLLDEEKAIVTDIPGTTRDVVEGSIRINGVLINFLDTAGVRKTDNTVEKIGVEKSLSLLILHHNLVYYLNLFYL